MTERTITKNETLTAFRAVAAKNPRRSNGPKPEPQPYVNSRHKAADLIGAIVHELKAPTHTLIGAGPVNDERDTFAAIGFAPDAIDVLARAQQIADTRYGTSIGRLGWRSVYALVLNGVGTTS